MVKLLHLSDLHIVGNPHWGNMRDAVLDYARREFGSLKSGEKFLVLTGDFHNYEQDGYDRAAEFLRELFDAMGIAPGEDAFAVPGNHDVSAALDPDLSQQRKLILENIKIDEKKRDELNQEGGFRAYALPVLLKSYAPYAQFVRNLGLYRDADENRPVKTHVRIWRNKLKILHLNTTLVADGSEKTNQITDTLTATSEEVRKQLDGGIPCIAIGHNSYKDLTARQQKEELRGVFYYRNISAYLCGDRHKTDDEQSERWIDLGTKDDAARIPNIVAPRGSSDAGDVNSEFGFLVHEWNEETGDVDCSVARWRSNEPVISPERLRGYAFRNYPRWDAASGKSASGTYRASGTVSPFNTELFERRLSEIYREYGYRIDIARLHYAGTNMLDMLKSSDIPFTQKADAVALFKRNLRKTIQEMEDDFEDFAPAKFQRVKKLEELLTDLSNI